MPMKTKIAMMIGAVVILVAGMIALVEWKRTAADRAKSESAKVAAVMQQVRQVNVPLPDRQTQAKMLVMAAWMGRKVPEAANWCDRLNAGAGIWPVTPTNTIFALNTNMAGRVLTQGINGDTVVFFEAANAGWNQAGGAELLAANPGGVAVALADGRALIVSPSDAASLRWTP